MSYTSILIVSTPRLEGDEEIWIEGDDTLVILCAEEPDNEGGSSNVPG